MLLLFWHSTGSAPPTPEQFYSGGYGFGAHDSKRRKERELEDDERQELADRLEAVLVSEGSITHEQADLLRLRGLANEYQNDLPSRVRRAVAYAEKVRTQQALELALREIQLLQDEEDIAVLLTISLDD